MKRLLAFGLSLGMVAALAVPAFAAPAPKVWLCHFNDHQAPAPYTTWDDITVDWDYVIAYENLIDGYPKPRSVEVCEVERGGNLIYVNANALNPDGHWPIFRLERVDDYPL